MGRCCRRTAASRAARPPTVRSPNYFQQAYGAMGGRVDVVFANSRIEVSWSPATETVTPTAEAMAGITPLLKQRRYGEAQPLLEALLEAEPENRDVLYNLGMVASDEGQLKEARKVLRLALAPADKVMQGGQRLREGGVQRGCGHGGNDRCRCQ